MVGLKKYSVELYTKLAADPDRPITYRRDDGGIRLGYDQQDLDGYSHFVGMAKGMGVDFQVLGPTEMAEAHPLLDVAGLTCGLWDLVDGDIDPTGLVNGLVHARRKNGGQAFKFTDVVRLTQIDDAWTVHTNRGDIECESIVDAAGYRVHQVGNFYGLESAVSSMEHQFFLTALGYVEPEFAAGGTTFAIDIIGKRSPATVRSEPMFDPKHDRPRVG